MFEDQIFWESRRSYFKIINDFLTNQIDGNNFCTQIQNLRGENLEQAEEAVRDLEFKTDFKFTSKSIGFTDLVDDLNSFAELFKLELNNSESNESSFSENVIRSKIKEMILPKFLKYL